MSTKVKLKSELELFAQQRKLSSEQIPQLDFMQRNTKLMQKVWVLDTKCKS